MIAAVSLHIPTQTASTTDEWYVSWPYEGTWDLVTVQFAPATAVAIDGTNTLTGTISANPASAGTFVSVASHTTLTGGTALVLGTTISPTVTRRTVTKGSQIRVAKTVAGTGQILDGTYVFAAQKVV